MAGGTGKTTKESPRPRQDSCASAKGQQPCLVQLVTVIERTKYRYWSYLEQINAAHFKHTFIFNLNSTFIISNLIKYRTRKAHFRALQTKVPNTQLQKSLENFFPTDWDHGSSKFSPLLLTVLFIHSQQMGLWGFSMIFSETKQNKKELKQYQQPELKCRQARWRAWWTEVGPNLEEAHLLSLGNLASSVHPPLCNSTKDSI